MRLFCGLDIGLSGGIAVLDEQAKVHLARSLPTTRDPHGKLVLDVNKLCNLLLANCTPDNPYELVAYEFVHSFGHESRSACFSFGRSAGRTQAVVELLGYPFIEPTPQAWKADVLAGTKKDKAAAIGFCNGRWPGIVGTHDGIADSLCLAEYARRQSLGGSHG